MDGFSEDTEILAQRLFNQQWPREPHPKCAQDTHSPVFPCSECDMYQGLTLIEMALNTAFASGWEAAVKAVAELPIPRRDEGGRGFDRRVSMDDVVWIRPARRQGDHSQAFITGVGTICSCMAIPRL